MRRTVVLLILSVSLSAACSLTHLRNKQIEAAAKDWSLVIRGSQVIPVYPLTEDLQPGDVLLVSTPIEQQADLYRKSGFLPLDQMLVRLLAGNYRDSYENQFIEYYDGRYGTGAAQLPPGRRESGDDAGPRQGVDAPRAAFPAYQFSVRTGSGINLAIPIQGVPFALGLMNSGSASGTVTISDAYTYGLDNYRLERLVRDWADSNRLLLRNYEPRNGSYSYLRVVSRVYLTGGVDVSVSNDQARAADVSAAADRPVDLLQPRESSRPSNGPAGEGAAGEPVEASVSRESYKSMLKAVNVIADEKFGGRVRIATASSRSVTMSETFERPLVVGYVGFDMPVYEGGRLGAPISTLEQLREPVRPAAGRAGSPYRLAALPHVYSALGGIEGDAAARIRAELDGLVRILPDRYPFAAYEFPDESMQSVEKTGARGDAVDRARGFASIMEYAGRASMTVETLERYLPMLPGRNAEAETAADLARDLREARAAVRVIEEGLYGDPVLMRAIDFVFLGE